MPHTVVHPHTFACPHTFIHPIYLYVPWHPHIFIHPHMSPMLSYALLHSRGYLHVVGDVGHFLCWGSGGVSISVRLLVSVSTYIGCLLCFILCFLVVLLCLKFLLPWLWLLLSSDCGVFWYVIYIISDCGSLFDGTFYNVGSAWCGSAATPDTKMLWRCLWPCLHATAATSIFNASSGLCQLCHGFSRGRFLFKSWASHCLYIICLFWCLLSTFKCYAGCHIHPGGSHIGVCTPATPWSLPMAGICVARWWSLAHTRYAQSGCSLHYIE